MEPPSAIQEDKVAIQGGQVTNPVGQPTPVQASTEDAKMDDPPTIDGLMTFINPLLYHGISMESLRWKTGHGKGRTWTDLLNKVVGTIIDMKVGHLRLSQQASRLKDEYKNGCGSLMIGMSMIRLMTDGRMPDGWEKQILYSNWGGSKNAPPNQPNNQPKSVLPPIMSQPTGSSGQPTKEPEFDLDEALKYIECVAMCHRRFRAGQLNYCGYSPLSTTQQLRPTIAVNDGWARVNDPNGPAIF